MTGLRRSTHHRNAATCRGLLCAHSSRGPIERPLPYPGNWQDRQTASGPDENSKTSIFSDDETTLPLAGQALERLGLVMAALEGVGDGVLIIRGFPTAPESKTVFANPAASDITGYEGILLENLSPRQLLAGAIDTSSEKFISTELSSGRSVRMDMELNRRDGSPYVGEVLFVPVEIDSGRQAYYLSLIRRIDDKKGAEAKPFRANDILSPFFDMVAEAIISFDSRGRIVSANRRVEDIFGYMPAELPGMNILRLIPSPFSEKHEGYIDHCLETYSRGVVGYTREIDGARKDRTKFPLSVTIRKAAEENLYTAFIQDLSGVRSLQRQALEAARDEDRRIGLELHDGLQQQLTGLSLLANNLTECLADQGRPESNLAARLEGGIKQVLDQVQLLCRGLIPAEIESGELSAALQNLTHCDCMKKKLQARFYEEGVLGNFDRVVATHLYRIAQEAVTNAIKHSNASRLEISLNCDDQWISLVISDDGVGPDSTRRKPGIGLRMMNYRAQLIGAILRVEKGAAGGTRVHCKLKRPKTDV